MKPRHIKPKLLAFEVEVSEGGSSPPEPLQTRLVWGVSWEDALRRARLRLPHGCRAHTERAGARAA